MPYKYKQREKEYQKEYRKKNKDRIRTEKKEYYQKNKERLSVQFKEYRQKSENKLRAKVYQKEYRNKPENKSKEEKYQKDYYQKNKEKIEVKREAYMKAYMKVYNKKYRRRPEVKTKRNNIHRQLIKDDLNYCLVHKLRNALYKTLKLYSKTGKIMSSKKYGINFIAIIIHLKPFPTDIENYHIDHIIPLSLFDFNNPVHIKKAFLPENHQWLTIKENLEKSNKLVMPH